MLQYSVHPPPLSVSFSKKNAANLKFRNNDPRRPPPLDRRHPPSLPSSAPTSASLHPYPPFATRLPQLPPLKHLKDLPPTPKHLNVHDIRHDDEDDLPSPSFPPTSLPKAISRPSIAHAHAVSDNRSSYFPGSSPSTSSSRHDDIPDVLSAGDVVGPSAPLLGEPLRLARLPVSTAHRSASVDQLPLSAEFEVIRKLGTGSYAVVYLVREVLSRPVSDDGHFPSGKLELDSLPSRGLVHGREYAVKLLSKANLDREALDAQLFEATIHESLPSHPNLVSLYRTFETPSYLLLLLEYVPGEDLFYFLEQARDHYSPPSPSSPIMPSTPPTSGNPESRTPPTPGLLSSLHPNQLLSPIRLRLIASMFAQMCEAVAVCHDQGVFHRDIKPENFIVTDGITQSDLDGRQERRVLVKLSDFGLSTMDVESGDMDCGSAPYMSYECRNNVAPTYRPRPADVWSLGIVLINMLYHCNPWTDTADGVCASFTTFRHNPTGFFLDRFAGMTHSVASFLAERVFCILPDANDDSARCSAREFGTWVRDLPSHFGQMSRTASYRGHSRGASLTSMPGIGHALGSVPPSRRPSSRIQSRVPSTASPMISGIALSRALSRAPSLGPVDDVSIDGEHEHNRLAPVLDQEQEDEEIERQTIGTPHDEQQQDDQQSRTSTSTKRRKRGARKGKGSAVQQQQLQVSVPVGVPVSPGLDTSEMLASASQMLARELSRASKSTTKASLHSLSPSASMSRLSPTPSSTRLPPIPALPITSPPASPSTVESRVVVKKPSKWRLGFGSSKTSESKDKGKEKEDVSTIGRVSGGASTGRAANVSDLILGLNALPPSGSVPTGSQVSSTRSRDDLDDDSKHRSRGRQPRGPPSSPLASSTNFSASGGSTGAFGGPFGSGSGSAFGSRSSLNVNAQQEKEQPWSRSPVRSAASSSTNSWRSSMASTNTSSSTFTRYSNTSMRSVSTNATSISSTSGSDGNWRNKVATSPGPGSINGRDKGKGVADGEKRGQRVGKYPYPYVHGMPPPNVKLMTGVPWELNELPRQLHPKPHGDIFGQPPPQRRVRKPKSQNLGTISESVHTSRVDAGTSTTDLASTAGGDDADPDAPRKVQRGQINALAKMLGALRR